MTIQTTDNVSFAEIAEQIGETEHEAKLLLQRLFRQRVIERAQVDGGYKYEVPRNLYLFKKDMQNFYQPTPQQLRRFLKYYQLNPQTASKLAGYVTNYRMVDCLQDDGEQMRPSAWFQLVCACIMGEEQYKEILSIVENCFKDD